MGQMTDIMVDHETTHTDPEEGGILQLAAIKFNAETLEIGDTFDRCPTLLPRRHWSQGTKDFWNKHPVVYREIVGRQEPARGVFEAFQQWVLADAPDGGYRFWAKPVKFDWPFLESHFIQLGLDFPFGHWKQVDLMSHIGGMLGTPDYVSLSDLVPFHGKPHNALHDCAHQIDMYAYVKSRHVKAEILG